MLREPRYFHIGTQICYFCLNCFRTIKNKQTNSTMAYYKFYIGGHDSTDQNLKLLKNMCIFIQLLFLFLARMHTPNVNTIICLFFVYLALKKNITHSTKG